MEKPVSLETEPTTTTEHLEEATSGMLRGKQLLSSLFRGGVHLGNATGVWTDVTQRKG